MDKEVAPSDGKSSWSNMKGAKLSPGTLKYLEENLGFKSMAPVQARVVPLLLSNYDVVVEAITGSGKTLAYLIPCLEMLLKDRVLRFCQERKNAVIAVIVLPSRELAQQVFKQTQRMLNYVNLHSTSEDTASKGTNKKKLQPSSYSSQCFIGGRDIGVDISEFSSKGGNILIGTPGRMYELIVSSKSSTLFDFSGFEILILDEADKLLEFGFKAKLDAILKRLPKQRRTGLFSATQTTELTELARAGMRNPVSVTLRTKSSPQTNASKPQIPDLLVNYYAFVKMSEKLDRLVDFLNQHREEKIIVYMLTCASVDWLYEALCTVLLPDEASNIFSLHGQMKLTRRQRTHSSITKRTRCVLVCTDVAARGLDIPEVSIVLQYDPPVAPSTFIHRIGRTARMGKRGTSVVFLAPQELEYVAFMQLQNVSLMPLDSERDSIDLAREEVSHLNAKRTLMSSAHRDKRKEIHQAHRLKQLSRKERRQKLREEHQLNASGTSLAAKNRKEVLGDLCTSPSVLALRRAARHNEKLLTLASRAFVSFIRAYKEHECRYIFQLQLIDFTELTHSFALYKVPNCGEIKHMNILKIPLQDEFKDMLNLLNERLREKREREEKKREEDMEIEEGGNSKRHRTERNEKLEALKMEKMTRTERSKAWRQAELDELLKDSYYIKKERQGRVNKRLVDEKMGVQAIENALLSSRERKNAKKNRN